MQTNIRIPCVLTNLGLLIPLKIFFLCTVLMFSPLLDHAVVLADLLYTVHILLCTFQGCTGIFSTRSKFQVFEGQSQYREECGSRKKVDRKKQ